MLRFVNSEKFMTYIEKKLAPIERVFVIGRIKKDKIQKIPRRTTRRRGIGRLTMCRRGDGTPQDIIWTRECQVVEELFFKIYLWQNLPNVKIWLHRNILFSSQNIHVTVLC
jgi:hypothetical protein